MSKADAWMPLYIADYLRDTMNLTTELHGAYLLLLMHAWTQGGRLPNNDLELSGITKLSPAQWRRAKAVLMRYFDEDEQGLYQGRAVREAEKAQRLSDIRRETGSKGGRPPKTKLETKPKTDAEPIGYTASNQNGSQTETPSPSPLPPEVMDATASLSLSPDDPASDDGDKPKYPPDFEAVWKAYPHAKGRSSKSKSHGAWRRLSAARRTALPSAIVRYARDGREPKAECGAPAMERWLARDLDLNWHDETGPDATSARPWPGPADLRAAVVAETSEEFARSYLDPCGWRNGPERVVTSPNDYRITELRRGADHVLKRFNAKAIVERIA